MKKVKLLQSVTGTRNNEDWPRAGAVTVLPDAEAKDLITAGIAERTTDEVTHRWAADIRPPVQQATASPPENAAGK